MERFLEILGYLLSGTLAFYLSEKRSEWRSKRKHKAEHDLNPCIERDSKINARLAQLLFALNADKAKVFRFHNGNVYYDGTSIQKFSLSHLQLKNGVAGPQPNALKDIPSSLFPKMLNLLLNEKGTLHWRLEDAPDDYLKSLHMSEGTTFVKVAPLHDVHGHMLGFLSLNWLSDQPDFDKARRDTILRFAIEIGDLLSQDKPGQKTPKSR